MGTSVVVGTTVGARLGVGTPVGTAVVGADGAVVAAGGVGTWVVGALLRVFVGTCVVGDVGAVELGLNVVGEDVVGARDVGDRVGAVDVGESVIGAAVGFRVGDRDGVRVGALVGRRVGVRVGRLVGLRVGTRVGARVGMRVGDRVGGWVTHVWLLTPKPHEPTGTPTEQVNWLHGVHCSVFPTQVPNSVLVHTRAHRHENCVRATVMLPVKEEGVFVLNGLIVNDLGETMSSSARGPDGCPPSKSRTLNDTVVVVLVQIVGAARFQRGLFVDCTVVWLMVPGDCTCVPPLT